MTLQPCTPADAEIAVPLIYASGPAAFDFVFKNEKQSAHDFLRYAFVRSGGEFSFDNHYALWNHDKIVGVGAIFGKEKASKFIFADAKNIIRFYKWKSIQHGLNGLKIETMIKLPKEAEITIGHLGIKEELRGKGYGSQLISLLMERSNKQATQKFVLDVSAENLKAQALYERLGFVPTQKYVSNFQNKFSKVPDHFRMELKLSQ